MTGDRHDELVVLHSMHGIHAAKRIILTVSKKTGEARIRTQGYSDAKHFRVTAIPVNGPEEFWTALDRLERDPQAFVIRGAPLPNINRNHARRLLHKDPRTGEAATFEPRARRWVLFDFDHQQAPALTDVVVEPEAAIEYIVGQLPPECHDVSCRWQFTSSQGLPGNEDFLSVRLAFWLARLVSDEEWARWSIAVNRNGRVLDPATLRTVQPIYTARPRFDGMPDPLPRRSGIRRGLEDALEPIIPPPDAKNPRRPSGEGYEPGLGVQAYLAQIGGPAGFRRPMLEAIGSFVAINGADADPAPLYKAIRERLDEVEPGWRADPKGQLYADDDHLNKILKWTRQHHGDQPPKRPRPPEPPPAEPDDLLPPQPRPEIRIGGGRLPEALDAAEAILIESDHDVYTFGDQVVRPALRPISIADDRKTIGLRLVPIGPDHMVERFTRVIDFKKLNSKTGDWVSIDCPRTFAGSYLARTGLWRLPQLTALTTCPLFLADGRIIDKPGFDATSGVLFDPQGVEFPAVPPYPTRAGAIAALEFLMAPFREFPFVDEPSKSVLRSLLLSTVSRFAYAFIPCHAFDAPLPGTGKSKLFDCASILLNGRECAVVSQPEDEVEFEKKLFAEMLAGEGLVTIDNCSRALEGPFICMVLTQKFVKSRLLGLSKNPEIPSTLILGANGNNFTYAGDMLRRGLTGHLDAGEEKPWEREFNSEDPVFVFKRERPRFVTAALTVLRGYMAAGRPAMRAKPLGGFEEWCHLVRDALLWLGASDPTDTIDTARKADPARQNLEAVIMQWRLVLKGDSLTTREIIDKACRYVRPPSPGQNQRDDEKDRQTADPAQRAYYHPQFRNALLDVANDRGHVSVNRLGYWLRDNKGKIVSIPDTIGTTTQNYRLAAATLSAGHARWKLEQQRQDGTWQ